MSVKVDRETGNAGSVLTVAGFDVQVNRCVSTRSSSSALDILVSPSILYIEKHSCLFWPVFLADPEYMLAIIEVFYYFESMM